MKFFIVLAAAAVATAQLSVRTVRQPVSANVNVVNNGAYVANQVYPPTPFEYSYSSEDVEGSHSATQSGDGNGRITGSYTISLADGRTRTVNYVADENGYRAEVTTNELGTETSNPADVVYTSSALTGEQAALQYGPPAPERQVVQRPQVQVVQRPQAALRAVNSQVALPSYGTFAGVQARRN